MPQYTDTVVHCDEDDAPLAHELLRLVPPALARTCREAASRDKKQDGQSVGVGRGLDPKRERGLLLPEFAEGRAQQAVEHTWRLRESGGPALYFG